MSNDLVAGALYNERFCVIFLPPPEKESHSALSKEMGCSFENDFLLFYFATLSTASLTSWTNSKRKEERNAINLRCAAKFNHQALFQVVDFVSLFSTLSPFRRVSREQLTVKAYRKESPLSFLFKATPFLALFSIRTREREVLSEGTFFYNSFSILRHVLYLVDRN